MCFAEMKIAAGQVGESHFPAARRSASAGPGAIEIEFASRARMRISGPVDAATLTAAVAADGLLPISPLTPLALISEAPNWGGSRPTHMSE